jgi:hypothetical protein
MSQNDTILEGKHRIKPQQGKAIVALLSCKSVTEAARAAKVPERTLWRWLGDPAFRLNLVAAEADAIDQATRRLIALQEDAIGTVEAVMRDTEQPASVRLRAAQSVLDYLLRLRELRNVEARLQALEVAYLNQGGVQ